MSVRSIGGPVPILEKDVAWRGTILVFDITSSLLTGRVPSRIGTGCKMERLPAGWDGRLMIEIVPVVGGSSRRWR